MRNAAASNVGHPSRLPASRQTSLGKAPLSIASRQNLHEIFDLGLFIESFQLENHPKISITTFDDPLRIARAHHPRAHIRSNTHLQPSSCHSEELRAAAEAVASVEAVVRFLSQKNQCDRALTIPF